MLILGERCNYRVTNNDSAWNAFLKKGSLNLTQKWIGSRTKCCALVGHYIEYGEFRAVRARPRTSKHEKYGKKQPNESDTSETSATDDETVVPQKNSNKVAEDILKEAKLSIGKVIDRAEARLATESSCQRDKYAWSLSYLRVHEKRFIVFERHLFRIQQLLKALNLLVQRDIHGWHYSSVRIAEDI